MTAPLGILPVAIMFQTPYIDPTANEEQAERQEDAQRAEEAS